MQACTQGCGAAAQHCSTQQARPHHGPPACCAALALPADSPQPCACQVRTPSHFPNLACTHVPDLSWEAWLDWGCLHPLTLGVQLRVEPFRVDANMHALFQHCHVAHPQTFLWATTICHKVCKFLSCGYSEEDTTSALNSKKHLTVDILCPICHNACVPLCIG